VLTSLDLPLSFSLAAGELLLLSLPVRPRPRLRLPCCSLRSHCSTPPWYCKASTSFLLAQLALLASTCCSPPNQVQPWLEVASHRSGLTTGKEQRPPGGEESNSRHATMEVRHWFCIKPDLCEFDLCSGYWFHAMLMCFASLNDCSKNTNKAWWFWQGLRAAMVSIQE
jgi:hypothetical protein